MKDKGDPVALNALERLGRTHEKAEQDLIVIKEALESSVTATKEGLFSGKYNRPVILAFLLAFFNQLSGINFVLYYAPEILERAGLASGESLFSSISIGIINLVFTFVGIASSIDWAVSN